MFFINPCMLEKKVYLVLLRSIVYISLLARFFFLILCCSNLYHCSNILPKRNKLPGTFPATILKSGFIWDQQRISVQCLQAW